MSFLPLNPCSSHSLRHKSWVTCQAQLIAVTLFAGLQTLPISAALAAGAAPGTVIRNQATGSFVDPKEGLQENIESNVVQVTVAEVAGVTVKPTGLVEAPTGVNGAGPSQGNGNFDPEDLVYFVYEITNVGNDPTQFFIPGTASSITNGSQVGQIEIIEVDSDGPGPNPPTNLQGTPVPIQNSGNNTGDTIAPGQPLVLGLPQGSLPPDGTLKVRVPVKFNAGLNPGDQVTAVLGDTNGNDNSANTQNQVYSANGSSGDLYTQDNGDGDGIANETPGVPANGDSTNHRQEASARLSATVNSSDSTTHTVSGVLFLDNDGNDAFGTEPGLANVTVHLYEDLNNDGILDLNDDQNGDGVIDTNDSIASDVTDSNGAYSLQALDGNYLIQPDINDPDLLDYTYGGVTNTANDPLNNPRNIDINGSDVTTGLDFPYDVSTNGTDFGDAPDTYGTDATANNSGTGADPVGPSHTIVSSIYLGSNLPDGETDASTPLDGTGDGADEDGITLPTAIEQGSTFTRTVKISGAGLLNAWIDWDGNGTFDPAEQIATNVIDGGANDTDNAMGTISLNISVPPTATVGNTFARFRYSSESLGPTGAAIDGEVEDYGIEILAANPNQIVNDTPSNTSCPVQGGRLSGGNLFTALNNGTMGTASGSPDQSPATNPYPGIVTGGTYAQYGSPGTDPNFRQPTYGQYSYVANIQNPRNSFQHNGTTDPVYGAAGRFFVSDPNNSTPTMTVTLNGLTPNRYYEYSFWAANAEPTGPSSNNIDIVIDGQVVYSTGDLPFVPTLTWRKHTFTFTNGPNTSVVIDLASTKTGEGGNDFYLDNIEVQECIFDNDYGDTPTTYGDAIHTTLNTNPQVYLGAVPADSEFGTQLGGDAGAGADGDDGNGDDEEAFVTLPAVPLSGTYTLSNIPVNNTSGNPVTLHSWVDFNQDGQFGPSEYTSATVANGATTANLNWSVPAGVTNGQTYARFRISPNDLLPDNGATPTIDERSQDAVIRGEVEDYPVIIGAVSNNPNVLLVKRITAVNGSTTNDSIDLAAYDPDPTYPYDDNVIDPAATPPDTDKWPVTVDETSSTFLLGTRNAGVTKPDDEIEYTIYFLSTGEKDAFDVQLCDRLPDFQTYVPDAFNFETPAPNGGIGANRGILIEFNGNRVAHTNDADGDLAQYYPPGSTLPAACNGIPAQTEDNGAVVVNLGIIPKATSAGNPLDSFGFIRFRAKVK